MPLYNFKCNLCSASTRRIEPPGTDYIVCPHCNEGSAVRMPSLSSEPTVKVVLDKSKKKSVMRGINEIMRKRSKNYQRKYELGEMIGKHGYDQIKRTSSFISKETGKTKTRWDEK